VRAYFRCAGRGLKIDPRRLRWSVQRTAVGEGDWG